MRRAGFGENDGCEANGQHIPFKTTKAERLAAGDPRRSVEERYPTFDQYFDKIERAVDNMVRDRLLLCEDADNEIDRLVQAGLAAGVPPSASGVPQVELRHCKSPKPKGGKK